jgi:hypothetical protein
LSDPRTHVSVTHERLIYESSNGDKWWLCEDPRTGLPAVRHNSNPQSGGHISYFDAESFLLTGRGPEHEALRNVIRQEHPSTFLIAYDIHPGQDVAYVELTETIQSLGAWWHHLETVWIVRSARTLEEIRGELASRIGADDQLLVADITESAMEWSGVNEAGSSWLRANFNRDARAI